MTSTTERRIKPTIAIVDGVTIRMFNNDHSPPHFHATLGGDEILLAIGDPSVIRGSLPQANLRRILASAGEHQGALALNWIRCQASEAPERI